MLPNCVRGDMLRRNWKIGLHASTICSLCVRISYLINIHPNPYQNCDEDVNTSRRALVADPMAGPDAIFDANM